MPTRRSRQFCRALHKKIADDPQRWTTITAVADRLVDPDKAAVLAAELDGQGLVRVGGGHTKTIGCVSRCGRLDSCLGR